MTDEKMNVFDEEQKVDDLEVVDTYENSDESDTGKGRLFGKLAVGIAGAVGLGIALYKNREKLKEKRTERLIRKVEDQGFIVRKSKADSEDVDYVEVESDEEQVN